MWAQTFYYFAVLKRSSQFKTDQYTTIFKLSYPLNIRTLISPKNNYSGEHRNIQDTFYASDKALVQMDILRFGQLCLGIRSLLVIQVLSIFVLVCTS